MPSANAAGPTSYNRHGMIQRGDCPRLEFNGGKESPSQGQDIGAPSIALSGRNSPLDRYR